MTVERRSVAETRALLGPDAEGLTDAQVVELRDGMYAFVELCVGVPRRLASMALRPPVIESRRPRRARGTAKRSA